jgi:PTH1 family peptidyl-tRNA hydrolase
MRLIVGLGNPGKKYQDTPHNAGFEVCDRFAQRHRLGDESRKFGGLFRRGRVGNEDIGILKPLTYMNLSGDSVSQAVRYLPMEPTDVVLVFDEIELPAGKLRIRPGGGDGGHRGTRSVIERLGTRDFPRIRVGVGRPGEGRDPTGHLLSRVPARERERYSETIDLAVGALEFLLDQGVDEAMNRYNGRPLVGEPQEEEGEKKS